VCAWWEKKGEDEVERGFFSKKETVSQERERKGARLIALFCLRGHITASFRAFCHALELEEATS